MDIGTVIAYKLVTAQGGNAEKGEKNGVEESDQEAPEAEKDPTDQVTQNVDGEDLAEALARLWLSNRRKQGRATLIPKVVLP